MRLYMKRTKILCVAGVATVALLAGCDITNPGPVQDQFLAEPASQQGLVNGSIRRMSELMGYGTYSQALLAREIFPGGQIGAFGHDVVMQGGHVRPGTQEAGYWGDAQQARFIAETAIKRFTEVSAPPAMMHQAHLWAGYAYRVSGEWWCDAVIGDQDPEVTTPGSFEQGTNSYFLRAEQNFTAALGFASTNDQRSAALAGRAQARVWLGKWADASTDAAQVADDFVFFVPYDDLEQAYYNSLYWANAYLPYGSYTMDFTWATEYFAASGDPRTETVKDPAYPLAVGSLAGYGPVPWSNQTKYTSRSDDQRLASGKEMRLIQAEAILATSGAFAGAMTLINEVHTSNISKSTGVALSAVTATSATEAWTALKNERAFELFLEGRRLADERRWTSAGTPGTVIESSVDWNTLSSIFSDNPRSFCFDIPNAERTANPNVPAIG
jgi:starch-binding outer membrane protein, SusD/RagB family